MRNALHVSEGKVQEEERGRYETQFGRRNGQLNRREGVVSIKELILH